MVKQATGWDGAWSRRTRTSVRGVDLTERITSRHGELLLFALTPPRLTTTPERAREIAELTVERLRPVSPDGLVLYDIDDESERNPQERPFPFLPTMDPADYLAQHLQAPWPTVVYRALGKYDGDQLDDWIHAQDASRTLAVLVGGSSSSQQLTVPLPEAQRRLGAARPDMVLGSVAIPERHTRRGDEQGRMLAKQAGGVQFFVTQVVYDVNAAKNLVSDYHYACLEAGVEPVPLVFTFSVCGSEKTLDFLTWLGVDVPRWIANELRHATDTLDQSYELALATARDLLAWCRHLGVPVGFNVESVSIRREEIEASVRLAGELGALLHR